MKIRQSTHWALFVIFLLSFYLSTFSIFADNTYVGMFFKPRALRDSNNHETYIDDFEDFVDTLYNKGINTIVFDINTMAYHWQCDSPNGMSALSYPASGGFTTAELNEMAAYIRTNYEDMKIIIGLEILTHLESNAFSKAYPQYMVNEKEWDDASISYSGRASFVEWLGHIYNCQKSHVSNATLQPGTQGGQDYWLEKARSTRNPFNPDGEEIMFDMIDELIAAFTVDGEIEDIKPDAILIQSDEGYSWPKLNLNDLYNTEDLNHAEAFAMAINNAYTHITTYNPDMDVMMWGDMLDPLTNGGFYETTGAVDLINTNIIIVDWRYNFSWYRFDFQTGRYPSVKEFVKKGFNVITTSWKEPGPTAALIWSGNMAEAEAQEGDGAILGHWYASFFSVTETVPALAWALEDPEDERLNSLSGDGREKVIAIANSINATVDLIGVTQCAQNDTSWGTYPNCGNANDSDGIWGTEYRDYYYDSGLVYDLVSLPLDPVSYWDFEGDADDRMGVNDGTLTNGASIVNDSERGQVLELDGSNDYVTVADDDSLDMTDAFTVSCWIKLDTIPQDYLTTKSLLGKHYTEYELMVYPEGKLNPLSSDGNSGYESGISSWNKMRTWETGRWYHVAWAMDGNEEYLYVDGELIATGIFKSNEGTVAGTHDFNIGRRSGGGKYVDGRMDDVMVFDRVLSPAEVNYLYVTQDMPAPIGYWDFEGDADDRVGDNNGTLANGAYIDEDIERYNEEVLILDGTNDTVTCGNPVEFKLTGSRTITAWINPDSFGPDHMMVAGRYLWGSSLYVANDGRLRGWISGSTTRASSYSSAAVITTGEWQHVAMTFDVDGNKKIRLYRNGEDVTLSASAMNGTPTFRVNDPFTIGVDYNLSRYFFNGKIDNVKLFDFALSPSQIAVQYQLGESPELYDDLYSCRLDVKFDEGSGTTVNDVGSYKNDGTVYGSGWDWVSRGSSYALDFHDSVLNSYVNFGTVASLNLTGSRSISAWIKPYSNNGYYNVIAAKHLWGFSLYTHQGKLKGYVSGTLGTASSHSSTAIITTGEWQHVAMTFNIDGDKKVHLYYNGEEVSCSYQTTFNGSSSDFSARNFTIGANYTGTGDFFDGAIDNVKVFDKALSAERIMYYYLNDDI